MQHSNACSCCKETTHLRNNKYCEYCANEILKLFPESPIKLRADLIKSTYEPKGTQICRSRTM